MAVTVNVGFSRKVGEPNYGSRGASVELQVELDRAAIEDGEQFHLEIQRIFQRARDAVERELRRKLPLTLEAQADPDESSDAIENPDGRMPRLATPNQVRAIHKVAQQRGIDLSQLLDDEFGLKTADELTIVAASRLIDRLQSSPIPDSDSTGDR